MDFNSSYGNTINSGVKGIFVKNILDDRVSGFVSENNILYPMSKDRYILMVNNANESGSGTEPNSYKEGEPVKLYGKQLNRVKNLLLNK